MLIGYVIVAGVTIGKVLDGYFGEGSSPAVEVHVRVVEHVLPGERRRVQLVHVAVPI